MFKNYMKITLRNLKRKKGYAFIDVTGLVVGVTCFLLIMLYIRYELSYDTFHENANRIFRVASRHTSERFGLGNDPMAINPAPLASAMMETFPEVEYATRFNRQERLLLTVEETSFYESGLFADPHFFEVFSYRLLEGNKAQVLINPESIVISRRLANKFFGDGEAMGKTLKCSRGDFIVTGIVEDLPENSHIQFDWLIPFSMQFSEEDRDRLLNAWWFDNYYTYVVLKDVSRTKAYEEKLNVLTKKVYGDMGNEMKADLQYFLQPLDRVHLTSGYRYELTVTTDISTIRLFSIIAVFILLIACINAVNLSTAQASRRFKEIGIRKTVGARRRQLIRQFMTESMFVVFLAFVIAFGLVAALLPWFNGFIERTIVLRDFLHGSVVIGLSAVLILTGLLCGMYPALVLSSMKPVSVLQQREKNRGRGMNLRNILVLFQFSITIVLMIASLVIFRQIQFIRNKDLGYNREQILVMRRSDPGIRENFEVFKDALLQNPHIVDLTTTSQIPINIDMATGAYFPRDDGENKIVHYQLMDVDYNFIDMFKMDIIQGRHFSKSFGTDPENALIVNETFVNQMGWTHPIGKRISPGWPGGPKEGHAIVGVVKNFHARPLRLEIKPVILGCRPNNYWVHVRLRPGNIEGTITNIENLYNRFKTRYPFVYFFLDDRFNRMYNTEQKLGQMLVYFSGLAILIACLGIFGLATHTAERRTKEIGIRKILGASVPGVVLLLSREFTKWVLMANIFAWPVAYWGTHKWLQNFAFRVDLTIGIFIVSALLAIGIALLSVSYQSIKVSTSNPVEALRYE